MWYKKDIEEWQIANKVEFPNGDILKDNHEDSIDGWFWSDDEPEEFTVWEKEREEIARNYMFNFGSE